LSKRQDIDPRLSAHTTLVDGQLGDWYAPVIIGPSMVGERATSAGCARRVVDVMRRLEPDDYMRYLLAYYDAGLSRFGDAWRYADITTVLLAAAELAKPMAYLEIGVRRGRSMAMVASAAPDCAIVGFDLWESGYAGMENPGADFVRTQMSALGQKGKLELISGDSHATVPEYFERHPDTYFDLITVDGDHSKRGAARDLGTVVPRLRVGGILVFDDIVHPQHRYLAEVWRREIVSDESYACWDFTELGYGVALAVRKG
jgi:predicted O-methyltransferase YrrM